MSVVLPDRAMQYRWVVGHRLLVDPVWVLLSELLGHEPPVFRLIEVEVRPHPPVNRASLDGEVGPEVRGVVGVLWVPLAHDCGRSCPRGTTRPVTGPRRVHRHGLTCP